MKKNKNKIIIPLTILFCILYIIFAFRPLGTELYFEPLQTIDIFNNLTSDELVADKVDLEQVDLAQGDQEQVESEVDSNTVVNSNKVAAPIIAPEDITVAPFRLGQTLGYIDSTGKILYKNSFPWKSSITNDYFTTYDLNSTSFSIYNTSGKVLTTINSAGFPFIQEDRIFLFGPGGNNFAKYDISGSKLWQFERFAPITCFNSSKEGVTAGYSDGTLLTWTSDGSLVQNIIPGGSNHNVILGAAVSSDAKYTACISGIDKQRFVITKNSASNSKIVFHHYLSKEKTTQSYVKFSDDDSTVYYDTASGLGICAMNKTNKFRKYLIDVKGSVMQIVESDQSPFVFILAKKVQQEKTIWTVTALERENHIAGRFSFEGAENAFIQLNKDNLFVGTDTTISILKVGRK